MIETNCLMVSKADEWSSLYVRFQPSLKQLDFLLLLGGSVLDVVMKTQSVVEVGHLLHCM